MLNKCPAVLHIRIPGYHKLRFYIPSGINVSKKQIEVRLATKELNALVSDIQELNSLFSITTNFFDKFIFNNENKMLQLI